MRWSRNFELFQQWPFYKKYTLTLDPDTGWDELNKDWNGFGVRNTGNIQLIPLHYISLRADKKSSCRAVPYRTVPHRTVLSTGTVTLWYRLPYFIFHLIRSTRTVLLFLLDGVEGAQGLGAGSLTSVAGTGAGDVLLPRKSWKHRCGTGTVGTVTFWLVEPEPEP